MPTYKPEVFAVGNIEQAKAIILTPDTASTDERWERETPILAAQLARDLMLQKGQLILDYGCGIGRLAKAVILQNEAAVLGVDISVSMIQLAPGYVGMNGFSAVTPLMLDVMIAGGMRVDAAYSVWVIQHCLRPQEDLARIAMAIKPGGLFQMVNCVNRCVPTDSGWTNDGVDLVPILKSLFREVNVAPVPPGIEPANMPNVYYCATCRK